eukprot:365453-Chlamydomonas_euryale.AAC.8
MIRVSVAAGRSWVRRGRRRCRCWALRSRQASTAGTEGAGTFGRCGRGGADRRVLCVLRGGNPRRATAAPPCADRSPMDAPARADAVAASASAAAPAAAKEGVQLPPLRPYQEYCLRIAAESNVRAGVMHAAGSTAGTHACQQAKVLRTNVTHIIQQRMRSYAHALSEQPANTRGQQPLRHPSRHPCVCVCVHTHVRSPPHPKPSPCPHSTRPTSTSAHATIGTRPASHRLLWCCQQVGS